MEPERWRELEAILAEALERAPEARAAWLESRCGTDRELLREVQSMLAFEERSAEFMETPALVRDPRKIGPYEIEKRLATGGSAIVYEARHEDGGAPVALKVLRGSLFVDERRIRQFQREVKTLARLRHPAIARILEASSTEDGQQYFTMELVRGRRLDELARDEQPSIEERLWLFRDLCDAVHHAHRCGVVHRDIKPANVIVDEEGHPKILDFGLARLLETDATRASSAERPGEILGTLPYMSPEQARGRNGEVDARADVYSLGVVLYQLLTGELPFDLEGLPPYEALRVICDEAPVRPGVRRRELRGALETIVLTALRKDRDHRYPTAAALGEDVGRFLDGRAILAQPPGPLQRLVAMVAGHKLASGALASVFMALVVFGAVLWSKNRELLAAEHQTRIAQAEATAEAERASAEAARANSEAERASAEAARANSAAARAGDEAERAAAVVELLQSTLGSLAPDEGGGRDVKVREVLDLIARGLDRDLPGQPRLRAEMHGTIGRAYLFLGRDREAAVHLEAHLDLLRELGEAGLPLAEAHWRLAEALAKRGRHTAALEHLEASLELHRALHEDDGVVATILQATGRTLQSLGRSAEAEERLAEALALGRARLETDDGDALDALELVAEGLRERGRPAEAETLLSEALEHQIAANGEEHTRTARLLAGLGRLAIELGRYGEAEQPLRRSLEIRQALLGPHHAVTVSTGHNLGLLLVELGRLDEAEPLLLGVLESWRVLGLTAHEDYAATLATLGAIAAYSERFEDAEQHMRAALEVYRSSESAQKEFLADHMGNLAHVLLVLGKAEEAEELSLEALELRRAAFGSNHPEVAKSLAQLGDLRLAVEDYAGAEARYREALAIRRAFLPPGDLELADGTNSLAVALQHQGELEEAEALFRESLSAWVAALGEEHPSSVRRMWNLGDLLLERGELAEAESLLARALEIQRSQVSPSAGTDGSDPRVAGLAESLAAVRTALEQSSEAQPREAAFEDGDD